MGTQTPNQPNLAVVPLLTEGLESEAVVGRDAPDKTGLLGWNMQKRRVVTKATTLLYRKTAANTAHLVTLLIPLRPGENCPVSAVNQTGETAAQIFLADGRTMTIDCDPQPNGPIRFAEALPDKSPRRIIIPHGNRPHSTP